MKIKHNITRDGCTLSGQILETIFEGDEKRGAYKYHYSKDGKFYIFSGLEVDIYLTALYVWGDYQQGDNDTISCTYNSVAEAQKALDYINEFTVTEADDILAPGTQVYVSDVSAEYRDGLTVKILIDLGPKYESRYLVDLGNGHHNCWQYAVPVPPAPQKTERKVMMTDDEYEAFILLS